MNNLVDTTQFGGHCPCASNAECKTAAIAFSIRFSIFGTQVTDFMHVPGTYHGCFGLESFLLSTLECFYSNLTCLSRLKQYINNSLVNRDTLQYWFDAQPLIFNSTVDLFPPNSSISTIVSMMMLERWNFMGSYDLYYQSCSPSYCTYSYEARAYDLIDLLVRFLSIIGGLTVTLRIVSPRLVKIVLRLFKRSTQRTSNSKNISKIFNLFLKSSTNYLYLFQELL